MWHRGTPNPSDEPRTMLTISYFRRSYFYPYGEPYYNLDRQLFEKLDPRIQKVFDYAFQPISLLHWKMRLHLAFIALEQKPVLGTPVRWFVQVSWAIRLNILRPLNQRFYKEKKWH